MQPETELQMALRHLRLIQVRIAAQHQIIHRMQQLHGPVQLAQSLLTTFERTRALAHQHVTRLLAEQAPTDAPDPSPSNATVDSDPGRPTIRVERMTRTN
jgi:hypothetical protein